jgi:hypothetical protein
MRPFLAGFLLLLLAPTLPAAGVELIRVWPTWHNEEDFERISDYFGRSPENGPGREIVLRTHPDSRAGYYFLVRLKNATESAAIKFELSVIRPDALRATVFTFPAALRARESVYQLGLTGADWPSGRKVHPVAWKLTVLAADGRVLAEQKSFLWEKPAK